MNPTTLPDLIRRHRDSFPGPHLDMVLDSMRAGNTAGWLWAIPQDDGSPLLVLWDKGNNVLYLAGDFRGSSFPALAAMVGTWIRPRSLRAGKSRFKVRALSPSFEDWLPHLFAGADLREARTLFFVHEGAREVSVAPPSVANVALLPITADLLTSGAHAGSDAVRDEIRSMWRSEGRFFEHGFGSVAVLADEIICWCTSEYVGPTRCGIGIETSPRYEGRGVATATGAHFLRQARARGVTPCWECADTNRGSTRVAEKLGFVLQTEETYWVGSFAA